MKEDMVRSEQVLPPTDDTGGGSVKGYITPHLSWPRPTTPAAMTPAWAGEFRDFNDWVNFARQRLTGTCDPMMGNEVSAICVDTLGRRCSIGGHFRRAQEEGTFPIRFFWDLRPAEFAPEARATAQSSLSAEGAQEACEASDKPTEVNPNTEQVIAELCEALDGLVKLGESGTGYVSAAWIEAHEDAKALIAKVQARGAAG